MKNGKSRNDGASGAMIISTLKRAMFSDYYAFIFCIILFAIAMVTVPTITSAGNQKNILDNIWPLFIVAAGQTFVLITGGIDLSQSASVGFCSVAGAIIMSNQMNINVFEKSPLWGTLMTETGGIMANRAGATLVGILVMLAVGAIIGLINGVLIAKLKMAPFMVTLIMQMFIEALAIYITQSNNVMYLPESFSNIFTKGIGPVTYAVIMGVVVAAAAHILLTKTRYGQQLYATGNNARTSAVSGVKTDRVIIAAYIVSGLCAAIGAVLYSSRMAQGRATMGSDLTMNIVGAAVIGGTSMYGGRGKVIGTFFGVVFFVLLDKVLNLFNMTYYFIFMIKGLVVLLAAFLDVLRIKFKEA